MKFIPNYRVCYGGRFYEAGAQVSIKADDADMMKRHGTVLDEPTPPPAAPKKPGRPRGGRTMDNLARLKLRTNEPDEAILEDCLESAKAAIMARRYPFQEWPEELEDRYLICSLDVRLTSITESGAGANLVMEKTLLAGPGNLLGFLNRSCRK